MHDEKDEKSFKMFMAQLYVVGNVPQSAINKAFGINQIKMKRWVKKYQNNGPAAFYKKERKRRATVMTKEVIDKAQLLLDKGIPKMKSLMNWGLNFPPSNGSSYHLFWHSV